MAYLCNGASEIMQGVSSFVWFKEGCFFRIISSTDTHLKCNKMPHDFNSHFKLKKETSEKSLINIRTFVNVEPVSDCIYVPAPTVEKKRQPTSPRRECWLLLLIGSKGRFGQARTPNTTFPSSSNPNAIAYWSPLRNLRHRDTCTCQ